MIYKQLVNELRADKEHDMEKFINRLYGIHSEQCLKNALTETRWGQYTTGKIDRKTAIDYAIKRENTRAEKELKNTLLHLDAIGGAPSVEWLNMEITYPRHRIYGHSARAYLTAGDGETVHRYTETAHGYGYCKASTATASALNHCAGVIKLLCNVKEIALQAGATDTRPGPITGRDNRDILGYGSGYDVIPYFEGGVGILSLMGVLEHAGYKVSYESLKTCDYITAQLMEVKQCVKIK